MKGASTFQIFQFSELTSNTALDQMGNNTADAMELDLMHSKELEERFKKTIALGSGNLPEHEDFVQYLRKRFSHQIKNDECLGLLAAGDFLTIRSRSSRRSRCDICRTSKPDEDIDTRLSLHSSCDPHIPPVDFDCHYDCGDLCEAAYRLFSKVERISNSWQSSMKDNFAYIMSALDKLDN